MTVRMGLTKSGTLGTVTMSSAMPSSCLAQLPEVMATTGPFRGAHLLDVVHLLGENSVVGRDENGWEIGLRTSKESELNIVDSVARVRGLESEIIIGFVRANPKPVVLTVAFSGDGAVAPANFDSVDAAFLLKS
jgi:hypothetical protein